MKPRRARGRKISFGRFAPQLGFLLGASRRSFAIPKIFFACGALVQKFLRLRRACSKNFCVCGALLKKQNFGCGALHSRWSFVGLRFALRCIAFRGSLRVAFRCVALCCVALRYALRCALRCVALRCIALRCALCCAASRIALRLAALCVFFRALRARGRKISFGSLASFWTLRAAALLLPKFSSPAARLSKKFCSCGALVQKISAPAAR